MPSSKPTRRFAVSSSARFIEDYLDRRSMAEANYGPCGSEDLFSDEQVVLQDLQ